MRSVTYWLMGDRAGRVIFASWNWLWGKPIERGGEIAVEVARESLHAMQRSVHQLTEAVAKAVAACERAKQQYVQKQAEAQRLELQATHAFEKGHADEARLTMSQAIGIEKLLPQFKTQVQQAERAVQSLKDKLYQERQKLESYQVQMETLKALSVVSEALAGIVGINDELETDSACNHFQEAQAAIEGRNLQVHAFQELSKSPGKKQQDNLDLINLDREIEQRLLRQKATQNH